MSILHLVVYLTVNVKLFLQLYLCLLRSIAQKLPLIGAGLSVQVWRDQGTEEIV